MKPAAPSAPTDSRLTSNMNTNGEKQSNCISTPAGGTPDF